MCTSMSRCGAATGGPWRACIWWYVQVRLFPLRARPASGYSRGMARVARWPPGQEGSAPRSRGERVRGDRSFRWTARAATLRSSAARDFMRGLVIAAAVLTAFTIAQNQAESLSASFPVPPGERPGHRGDPADGIPWRPGCDGVFPSDQPPRRFPSMPRAFSRAMIRTSCRRALGSLIDADRPVVTTEQVLRGSSQVMAIFSDVQSWSCLASQDSAQSSSRLSVVR